MAFTYPFGFLGERKAPECIFTDSGDSGDSGVTTHTFTSRSLGAAHPTRYIVVGVHTANVAIDSATIGGVTATIIASTTGPNGGTCHFIGAAVPTGTTGNVVINISSTAISCKIVVYALYNLKSTTPVYNQTDTSVSSNAITLSGINIPRRSCLIAVCSRQLNIAHSWSGTAGETEDADFSSSANYRISCAHQNYNTAQSSRTVVCTSASSAGVGRLRVLIFN